MLVGREQEARETLVRLRRVAPDDSRIQLEMLEIKTAFLFEKESLREKYGDGISAFKISLAEYKSLFVVRHLYKRTIIACLLQIIQQFTGISMCYEYCYHRIC